MIMILFYGTKGWAILNYATLKRMVDLKMTFDLPEIQEQNNICEAC